MKTSQDLFLVYLNQVHQKDSHMTATTMAVSAQLQLL